ncbi:group II intron maturase-specific domain-containing protein [Methylobacter sp.]|uniref:group II intron maturase-specific domain-containing protein n=1 Tax=Methylobacter sp. TaxID=2051955 RepID=UPI0025CE43AE|nr:group II intron maturase-specific domain-containing protein [Methylobacter sp.]
MKDIIAYSQSKLRGWERYYGKYGRGKLNHVLFHVDKKLSRWAKRKYKKLKTITQALRRLNAFKSRNPRTFAHW